VSRRRKDKKQRRRIPEDHLDSILVYATNLMIAMGLPTYRLLIMKKHADRESIAEIVPIDGRYVAELYLCKDWLDQPDDVQRQTITHEVLHLWHRHLTDWLRSEVHDLVNVHDFIRIERQYQDITELMVDQAAMILSETHRLKESWEEAHGGQPQPLTAIFEGPTVN
jgi:hypothetical protein